MHCPHCRRKMISTSSQALEDEKGAMTITRWRCRPCHETAEEIWMSADYRGAEATRIRYAVAKPYDARIARRSPGRGVQTHAGAC